MLLRLFYSCIFICLFCVPANARTITDDGERTIEMDRPFTRIISLYAAHTENLFNLGLEDQIIGVTQNEDYPMHALEKPTFNARDGVEKFLAAKPDLILIRPMLDRGYAKLWAALERNGITVLSFQPNTIEEMYVYWRTLGRLTAREVQAESMVMDFKDGIKRAEQRLAAYPTQDRPGVFFESIHRKLSTFTPGSMPIFVLQMAGGINVADNAQSRHGTNIAPYGLERLLARSARIDVYLAQYGVMNEVDVNTIKNGPAASRIKAVRDGNVFLVDERLVSRPTMRLLTGIMTVHKLLHPSDTH